MDNGAFAALMKGKPAVPKMDKAEIKKLVHADMQRTKAKKHAPVKEPKRKWTPRPREESTTTYRDRAHERRTDSNADYDTQVPADMDEQTTKFLGGDAEHTHLVKGLDYVLLNKMRQQPKEKNEPKEPKEPKFQREPSLQLADRSFFSRGRAFDYDLSGVLMDPAKAAALPAVVSRSATEQRGVVAPWAPDLVSTVAAALKKKKRKDVQDEVVAPEPTPLPSDDIFEGVGTYTSTRLAPQPRHDDDDDDDAPSKYFAAKRRRPPLQPPPPQAPQQPARAPDTLPPAKLVHRDPIAGDLNASKPKVSRNFDGTDMAYGSAITYDSDDETYTMAKLRANEGKRRPPGKKRQKKAEDAD